MAEQGKEQDRKVDREDEIHARIEENKRLDDHIVNGIKTGKKKSYYDKPFDEQMYDDNEK